MVLSVTGSIRKAENSLTRFKERATSVVRSVRKRIRDAGDPQNFVPRDQPEWIIASMPLKQEKRLCMNQGDGTFYYAFVWGSHCTSAARP